jgi:Acetyl-coenzyme A synthetase N-terminus
MRNAKCLTAQIIRNVLQRRAVLAPVGTASSTNASIADPEAFWVAAARDVTWIREPRRVLDDANPPYYRWSPTPYSIRA